MIDFNGISTHLGLSYVKRFGNHVHSTFVFTFYVIISPGVPLKYIHGTTECLKIDATHKYDNSNCIVIFHQNLKRTIIFHFREVKPNDKGRN